MSISHSCLAANAVHTERTSSAIGSKETRQTEIARTARNTTLDQQRTQHLANSVVNKPKADLRCTGALVARAVAEPINALVAVAVFTIQTLAGAIEAKTTRLAPLAKIAFSAVDAIAHAATVTALQM